MTSITDLSKSKVRKSSRITSLLLVFLIPFLSASQSLPPKVEGTILDTTGEHLAYVNVGIVNKPIGTVSNNNGRFTLNLKEVSTDDTIKLSLAGYTPLKLAVKNLINNKPDQVFELEKQPILIEEVNITHKRKRQLEIGRKTTGGLIQATFNPSKKQIAENPGTEIGIKVSYSKKSVALIKDFNWYLFKQF